jgi:hypothetical protein
MGSNCSQKWRIENSECCCGGSPPCAAVISRLHRNYDVFPFIYFEWTEEVRGVEIALLQPALKQVGEYHLMAICTIGNFRE